MQTKICWRIVGSDALSQCRSTKRKSIVDADKGVVLVGDAAIGFPSALGIGTARGFEDATHLVRSLRSALEAVDTGEGEQLGGGSQGSETGGTNMAIADALREYEPEVMRERRAMHDVTVLAMQAADTPWLFMPKQVDPDLNPRPCTVPPNARSQILKARPSVPTLNLGPFDHRRASLQRPMQGGMRGEPYGRGGEGVQSEGGER